METFAKVVQICAVLSVIGTAVIAWAEYRENKTPLRSWKVRSAVLSVALALAAWWSNSALSTAARSREVQLTAQVQSMKLLPQRRVSPEERKAIIGAITDMRGREVVLVLNKSKESQTYAHEIGELFRMAGWNVTTLVYDGLKRTPSPFVVGVHPRYRKDAEVTHVLDGFKRAGLPFRTAVTTDAWLSVDVGVVEASPEQAAQDLTN